MDDYWQQPASTIGSEWGFQGGQFYEPPSVPNDMVYGFPRTRPCRVTKPRSAGNSPRSVERRRTTVAHGPVRYYPVVNNGYHSSLDSAHLFSAIQRKSRPVSWHQSSSRHVRCSSSVESAAYPYCENSVAANAPAELFSTASFNGLVTPVSYPTAGESISNEYISPLDECYVVSPVSQESLSLQTNGSQVDMVTCAASMPAVPSMPQYLPQEWTFDTMSIGNAAPIGYITNPVHESDPSNNLTAPPTPEMFPDQQFQDESQSQSEPAPQPEGQNEELIGVGLYDEPESFSLESTLLVGLDDSQEMTGKGLKLEETFTPSSDNESDGEGAGSEEKDDDDAEAQEEEEEEEQAPVQGTDAKPAESVTDAGIQEIQPNTTVSMSNKSFFDGVEYIGAAMAKCPPLEFSGPLYSDLGYGWI